MSIDQTPLQLPDGTSTTLGAYRGDPLVVILVRYFGCLPCQEYIVELDAIRDTFGADAKVVAVGGTADFQAEWLHKKKGVQMPLLLDPNQAVRAAVDLGDLTPGQMSKFQGAKNYLGALFGGFRPQRPTRDAQKAPGVAVFGEIGRAHV